MRKKEKKDSVPLYDGRWASKTDGTDAEACVRAGRMSTRRRKERGHFMVPELAKVRLRYSSFGQSCHSFCIVRLYCVVPRFQIERLEETLKGSVDITPGPTLATGQVQASFAQTKEALTHLKGFINWVEASTWGPRQSEQIARETQGAYNIPGNVFFFFFSLHSRLANKCVKKKKKKKHVLVIHCCYRVFSCLFQRKIHEVLKIYSAQCSMISLFWKNSLKQITHAPLLASRFPQVF
jgi:hypothetical protein